MRDRIKEIDEKQKFTELISKFEAEVEEIIDHLYDVERTDDQIKPWVYEHTIDLYKELLKSLRHTKFQYEPKRDELIILDLVDQMNH